MLSGCLLTIGVRPCAWNLHRAPIEVLYDELVLAGLEHLELLVEERMMATDDLHPLRSVSKDILSV
jgi:hypothetical protein